MKNRIVIAMMFLTLAATSLIGCGSSDQQESTVVEETTEAAGGTTVAEEAENTQLANPWTDSDRQGVLEATGFDMAAPEGASDVSYSYMAEDGLAQMTYILDGNDWTYRILSAAELTDISGLSVEWSYQGDATVAGLEGKDYAYGDINTDNSDHYQMIQWYDAAAGVTYSLSVYSLHDLGGMDIQVFAESIYQPLQGEASDDAEADAENEINEYFLGDFTSNYDSSTMSIEANSDDTYTVQLSLFRTMDIEDTAATFKDHMIYFKSTDFDVEGTIYRDSDNTLTVMITTTGAGYYEFVRTE